MLSILLFSAAAWDLEPGVEQTSELDLTGLDCVEGNTLRCAVPNGFTVGVISANATLLGTYPREASDVVWLPDQSGLVLCSPEGTFSVLWDGTDFGAETLLLAEGCTEAVRSEGSVFFLVSGSVYSTDGVTATALPLIVGGHDQIAADGVLLATGGGGSVTVHTPVPSSTTVPGSLGDLVLSDGEAFIASTDGAVATVDASPLGLTGSIAGNIDFDGDGTGDLIVKTSTTLVIRGSFDGSLRTFDMPDEASVVGVSSGEPCDDLILGYPDRIQRVFVDSCLGDADGDGFTTEAGDCNDSDFSVSPAATEVCNDIDEDCDGQLGDVQLLLAGPATALEGETITATWQTCGDTPIMTISPLGTCDVLTATCVVPDDGMYTVTVTPADAPGAGESFELTVANVAPTLLITSFTTEPLELVSVQLEADDPGDDEVTFRLLEGPDFVTLSAVGTLVVTEGKQGTHSLVVEMDDGDGGVAISGFQLVFGDGEKNQGGGCLCATSTAIPGVLVFGMVLLGLRRRRGFSAL